MQELVLADAQVVVARLAKFQSMFPELLPHQLQLNLHLPQGCSMHDALSLDPAQLLMLPEVLNTACQDKLHILGRTAFHAALSAH